jgi:hypothetical protein
MFVMLASFAYRTLADVIFHRDLHLREEVCQVQDVKHFRDPRMTHKWSIVATLHNQISYLC